MAGWCDPMFSAVEEAFEANLPAGLEAGAACAAVIDGVMVVDLWGGTADPDTGGPWERDTLVDCRSSTKGLTALCLAMLVDRGLVDFDDPVRRLWPELHADPTLRHALSHQAGIPIVDNLAPGAILHWEAMAEAVARQEPMWEPGQRHGYHGASFGWLVGEPVRRLTRTAVLDFLTTEVFQRLGVEGFMGTPPPGGGGVVAFVDPEARIGYVYLNNASWAGPPGQDRRSANLTNALYSCL